MPEPGRRAPRRLPAALRRRVPHSGRRSSKTCANGCARRPAPAGCCPGCRWRSATGIAFYFAADHEPVLSVAAVVAIALCAVAVLLAAAEILSGRRHDRGRRGGLCDRDLEDGADRAWRAGAADVIRCRCRALSKPATSASAPTVLCCAYVTMESAARHDQTGTRAAVGEEGHRARGRQLCRAEGAAVAAARAGAAGQLRFRPRHVLRGIGASGFVMGAIKTAEPPATAAGCACAMPP